MVARSHPAGQRTHSYIHSTSSIDVGKVTPCWPKDPQLHSFNFIQRRWQGHSLQDKGPIATFIQLHPETLARSLPAGQRTHSYIHSTSSRDVGKVTPCKTKDPQLHSFNFIQRRWQGHSLQDKGPTATFIQLHPETLARSLPARQRTHSYIHSTSSRDVGKVTPCRTKDPQLHSFNFIQRRLQGHSLQDKGPTATFIQLHPETLARSHPAGQRTHSYIHSTSSRDVGKVTPCRTKDPQLHSFKFIQRCWQGHSLQDKGPTATFIQLHPETLARSLPAGQRTHSYIHSTSSRDVGKVTPCWAKDPQLHSFNLIQRRWQGHSLRDKGPTATFIQPHPETLARSLPAGQRTHSYIHSTSSRDVGKVTPCRAKDPQLHSFNLIQRRWQGHSLQDKGPTATFIQLHPETLVRSLPAGQRTHSYIHSTSSRDVGKVTPCRTKDQQVNTATFILIWWQGHTQQGKGST